MNGVIKTFNSDKGYGFIVPEGKAPREADQFFHITECQPGYEPNIGDAVSFDEGKGREDKTCAVNVRRAS